MSYIVGVRMSMLIALAMTALVTLSGCPKHHRRTLVPNVPTSGDDGARQRFLEARERFLRDGSGQEDFAEIARDYPEDPIAPFAGLYAGIAAVQNGDAKAAIAALEPVVEAPDADAGLKTRAALFLGIAENDAGAPDKAVPLLARGEPAIENDDERGQWIASSAAATALVEPLASLAWMDRYWGVARDSEKGWILATLDAVVTAATPADAAAAWQALDKRDGPAAAVLGARVAADLVASGDGDGAAKIRGAIARARDSIGLPSLDSAVNDKATPGEIGAILPLDGKQARVGDAVARGLAIAAGAHGGDSEATIDVVDASGKDAAAAAVDELAAAGVIAIVGPIDGDSVDAAAKHATDAGVPLVSLNPRAEERPDAGRLVFHVMHSAEQRARILARHAKKLGLTKFAVLAPDSGYGKAVAAAFVDEVKDGGGKIVVRVDYANDTKSFAKTVTKLDGSWQAVFVPEQADRLELIAPALAAAGLVPRAVGGKVGKKQGRAIVLLSTIEGMSPEYVRDAGRHTVGALLAPGFYPDTTDATIAAFVQRYQDAHGKLPTAVDAYAADAVLAISVAAGREASRAQVARTLESVEVEGATGTVRFGKDHRRADDGVLFTVDDDGETVKTLR